MSSFKFIDFFAGIGGFRLALESLGGQCIGSSEIDSTAIETYKKNWPKDSEKHSLGDITKITKLPKHDFFVGGVPCQSWSIAGKNRGIEDPRGALWNEVIRLLQISKPKAFLFENVKGLSDPRHCDALSYLIESFKALDYHVYYKVLNSFDFGVPQNRDRIFIVGIQKDKMKSDFIWPSPVEYHSHLYEVFENIEIPQQHQLSKQVKRNILGERIGVGFNKLTSKDEKNAFFILTDIRNGPTSIHSWEIKDTSFREKEICITILKNRRKSQYGPYDGNTMSFEDLKELLPNLEKEELLRLVNAKILKMDDDGKFDFVNRMLSGGIDGIYRIYLPNATFFATITATGSKDVIATINIEGKDDLEYKKNFIEKILKPKKYRSLKSRELAKLQGYPETFILHEKENKNIKLFGNSVSVPVIKAIGKAVIETGCFD